MKWFRRLLPISFIALLMAGAIFLLRTNTFSLGKSTILPSYESNTSIWSSTATPSNLANPDTAAVELGVKFTSDVDGYISGIRFYKSPENTGTHVGSLWNSSAELLARATFTNETASGWQQVNFANPVAIQTDTVYVASYHTNVGRYSNDTDYFTDSVDTPPLHALEDGENDGNGVYVYSPDPAFPTNTFQASNYWVDVVFTMSVEPDTTPPAVTVTSPTDGAMGVGTGTTVSTTFSEAMDAATVSNLTFKLNDGGNTMVPATVAYNASTLTATLTPNSVLAGETTYTALLMGGAMDPRIKDLAGNALANDVTWTFTTGTETVCPCPLWEENATPALISANDSSAVELGVKFRSDTDGYITGIRFYKGPENTGTHVGSLWNSSGELLARATFTNETASGWQQVNFDTPVAIQTDTVYVASYHTNTGQYSVDEGYFAKSGHNNAPLHALQDGVSGGNGVYVYSAHAAFPTESFRSSNYWVNVIFTTESK